MPLKMTLENTPKIIQTSPHPRIGQTVYLSSPTKELDGAIVLVQRPVIDWRKMRVPHADIFMRRILEPHVTLSKGERVFQVDIKVASPNAETSGPYRLYQGVWVCESELGKVCNRLTAKLTDEQCVAHLENPNLCPFSNCLSEKIRIIGTSFQEPGNHKAKYLCVDCEGRWTQTLKITEVE